MLKNDFRMKDLEVFTNEMPSARLVSFVNVSSKTVNERQCQPLISSRSYVQSHFKIAYAVVKVSRSAVPGAPKKC